MQPPQQQIDISKTTGVTCANCDSFFFEESMMIRKISRFLTGTPQDQMTIIPVFRCQDCGEVCKEFFPAGMTDVEEALGLVKETAPKVPHSEHFSGLNWEK